MTATDASARLAAIRARHRPGYALTMARLIDAAKTTHPYADGPVIVQGCTITGAEHLRDTLRQAWMKDLPMLLDIVEAVLETKPSMHGDHGPIPGDCRYCEGEEAGLAKVRELIGNYLTYGTEDTTHG